MTCETLATSHRLRKNHDVEVRYGNLTIEEFDGMIGSEHIARGYLVEGGLFAQGVSVVPELTTTDTPPF